MSDETENRTPVSARYVVTILAIIQLNIKGTQKSCRVGKDARLQPTAALAASAVNIIIIETEKILAEFITYPAASALSRGVT
jgi:hypothetical protein